MGLNDSKIFYSNIICIYVGLKKIYFSTYNVLLVWQALMFVLDTLT